MFGPKAKWSWLLVGLALSGVGFPASARARELKVVSYNVWGLPSPLLRHPERFDKIPAAIDSLDADVVLVQEAFTGKAEALAKLPHFPYVAWGPKARFLHLGSGLMILSRYPIDETASIIYSHCGGFDCFASKGAVYARIRVPGVGEVSVFDTHLNANGHSDVRLKQAAHLMRFVRSYGQGLPTVVGGDFNGEPGAIFGKIRQALFLHEAHADYVEAHPHVSTVIRDGYTADPRTNPFLGRTETLRRLDHIFLMNGAGSRFAWKVAGFGLLFDGVHGKVMSDHFGVRVAADLEGRGGLANFWAKRHSRPAG